MTLRRILLGMALMAFSVISANAVGPLPSPLIAEDRILGEAYYDTLAILTSNNQCSEFFGGSESSVDIFNRLIERVRKDYLAVTIGIQMSGETFNAYNVRTKGRYRMFDKVSINANGPFYKQRYSDSQPTVPRVGSYSPNTREARALMLLHELGHVVEGKSGNWLLPDDGRDQSLSRENTERIQEICGDQIRTLAKGDLPVMSFDGKQKQPE